MQMPINAKVKTAAGTINKIVPGEEATSFHTNRLADSPSGRLGGIFMRLTVDLSVFSSVSTPDNPHGRGLGLAYWVTPAKSSMPLLE